MLKLWLVPKSFPLKAVTDEEREWSLDLSNLKRREYLHSRGYIREILGDFFYQDPLKVKLVAPPNKPPKLNQEDDIYISISHCVDYLFFGLSSYSFGLDIERTDRKFLSKKIVDRFYLENEKIYLNKFESENYQYESLKLWVSKEAAIKWNKGNLYKEIKFWECDLQSDIIINKNIKTKLRLNTFQFKNWFLSIASQKVYKPEELTACFYSNLD